MLPTPYLSNAADALAVRAALLVATSQELHSATENIVARAKGLHAHLVKTQEEEIRARAAENERKALEEFKRMRDLTGPTTSECGLSSATLV